MNSYSVPVCIDLLVHYIQLLKVSIFLCWKKKDLSLRLCFFVRQLERSDDVCFVPPKVQSVAVYFMYDRDNFKKYYKK